MTCFGREEDGDISFCEGGVHFEVASIDHDGGMATAGFGPEEISRPKSGVEGGREGTEGSVKCAAGVGVHDWRGTFWVGEEVEVHKPQSGHLARNQVRLGIRASG